MSKKKETINIESLINVLVKDFERYEHIKQFGCDDPFHPDGVNLNLKRNHIIYDKKQIEQYCKENNCSFPSEYNDIQTPERVPDEFIAGAEEIRTNAIKVKNVLKPLYEKLVETGRTLSPNQKDKICYNAVIRYYTNLEYALENGDFVLMRRYKKELDNDSRSSYKSAFIEALNKASSLEPEQFQMSLF